MCDQGRGGGSQELEQLFLGTIPTSGVGTRVDCVCASTFHSRSWARRAVFRLDRVIWSMRRFVYWSLSDPSHMYCIGLRENYYNRFKVPAIRFCTTSFFYLLTVWSRARKKKEHCVPEVPSAEQASKRYSNEALCFGTRCCVDPEVVATCWSMGVRLVGKKCLFVSGLFCSLFVFSVLVYSMRI